MNVMRRGFRGGIRFELSVCRTFQSAPGFLSGACSPSLATCSLNHTPLMSSYTTNHDSQRRPIDAFRRYLLPSSMPSYSLTSRMEKQITSLIKSERFANRSEVIRAGLRLLEDQEGRSSAEAAATKSKPPEPRPALSISEKVELNELRITKEARGLGRLNQERLEELEKKEATTKADREFPRQSPRSPQRKTPSAAPTPRQYPLPAPSRAPKRSRLAAENKPAPSPRSSRSR